MDQVRRAIDKPTHGSREWLRVRWHDEEGYARISASVAAAVHNCHPYMSAGALALELLAEEPPEPKEMNDDMKRGTTLEGPIRQWAADTKGIELYEPQVMYVYEEPGVRLIATLDAVDMQDNVFEIKTVKRRWDGNLPEHWYWQGVHQAICAGVDKIEWVIFDTSLRLHFHTQTVDSDEKGTHIQACREFLAAIDKGDVPEWAQYEYYTVQALYPESESGKSVSLDAEHSELLRQYSSVKAHIEALKETEEQLKARICKYMGDAELASVDGQVACKWKQSSRSSLDTKKLEQDHPALAAKYKKTTTYRTFTVTKEKS
jgi:predicted phage-related endonuclease